VAYLTDDPTSIRTPLDISTLKPLDEDFIVYEDGEFVIYSTDTSLPYPMLHVVLCNLQEEGNVVLWAPPFTIYFKTVSDYIIPNTAPYFASSLNETFTVEQCNSSRTIDWFYYLPEIVDS
jgi:hypothetical protein